MSGDPRACILKTPLVGLRVLRSLQGKLVEYLKLLAASLLGFAATALTIWLLDGVIFSPAEIQSPVLFSSSALIAVFTFCNGLYLRRRGNGQRVKASNLKISG